MTRHNGRGGKNGIFAVRHNDRNFDISHADHIDADRANGNLYWDVYNGFHSLELEETLAETFEEVERRYYADHYQAYVDGQNARNAKTRHTERNRSTEDIRHARKTCPEESIYQLGTMENHVSPEVLMEITTDFMNEFENRYGSHVHIIDWALHCDESTPHIHERHIFDAENQHGELCPQQEKALEDLGFDPPDPSQKVNRKNNRKMSFDSACRDLMFEICREHGLEIEEEPTYGGRKHLEKQDFIIQEQRKLIAEQQEVIDSNNEVISTQNDKIDSKEEKLTELTIRIKDVEALIADVSETAFSQAIEVVTDTACRETQEQDIKLINGTIKWLSSPDRKDAKAKREYAIDVLNHATNKIRKSAERVLQKVRTMLLSPQQRKDCIEQIKMKTRYSIRQKLNGKKQEAEAQELKRPEYFIEHEHQQII